MMPAMQVTERAMDPGAAGAAQGDGILARGDGVGLDPIGRMAEFAGAAGAGLEIRGQ